MTNTEPLDHRVVRACRHNPPCPAADATDHTAARVIVTYPEQGWSLLCNGVITFDDTGELLPDGTSIEPHPACAAPSAVAKGHRGGHAVMRR